jgi:hypothetical protein
MTARIGLIVGREWSFPPAFIEEVNRRDAGVTAEYVKIGAERMADPVDYAVIVDRFSHEVPFYRTYLKHAAARGVVVMNDPFVAAADDKYLGASLAARLGIATPRTVVLPHREHGPGIVHEEALRNLEYPLDWQGVVEYVGLPCVLKDAHGGAPEDVHVCSSLEELLEHYNRSGRLVMIVQEYVDWQHFVRCLVLGDEVLPMKYDPAERKYHVHHEHLTPDLGRRIVEDSLTLVRALGYEVDSVEWAIRGGVPHVVDFMNPVPDLDIYTLTPHYFEWAVERMADLAIRRALEPPPRTWPLPWHGTRAGEGPGAGPGAPERIAPRYGAGDLAEELPSLARGLPRTQL